MTRECPYREYKKSILRFLLADSKTQSILFHDLIKKKLTKIQEFMNDNSDDPVLKEMTYNFNRIINESKIKAVERNTIVLKEQLIAKEHNIKHPSNMSIIERKIYIVELQIDIGVYNIINNKKVEFIFKT